MLFVIIFVIKGFLYFIVMLYIVGFVIFVRKVEIFDVFVICFKFLFLDLSDIVSDDVFCVKLDGSIVINNNVLYFLGFVKVVNVIGINV